MIYMIRENVDRNFLIYELWKKGLTIDQVSFDTGIPRSTVGYYVRKFNKRAGRGEPIAFLPEREKPDEKDLAFTTIGKNYMFQRLLKLLGEGKEGVDKAYKFLWIAKLSKELQRDLLPKKEEAKALDKYRFQILKQILDIMVPLPKTEREESASLSDTQGIKGRTVTFRPRRTSRRFSAVRAS